MPVALLCVAQFVVVLDATIVAIALPAMEEALGLSAAAVAWVDHRLHARLRRLPALRGPARGPRRPPPRLRRGAAALRRRLGGLRRSPRRRRAPRRPRAAGARRRARRAERARAPHGDPAGGPRRAPRALAWWTAAAAGGGASGWVLGGVLSGLLDWRWVFLVNVPVCLAAAAAAPRLLPESREPSPAPPDLAGALSPRPGSPRSSSRSPPARPRRWSPAAAAFALFAVAERRAADPILPLAALRRRRVATPNGVALILTATTTPPMLLCTLHAQDVLGLDPVQAGLLFPPFNVAVVAGSLAGPARRRRARPPRRDGGRPGRGGRRRGRAARDRARRHDAPRPHGRLRADGRRARASRRWPRPPWARRRSMPPARASPPACINTSAQIGTALGLAVIVPLPRRPRAARAEARVDGYRVGFTVAAAMAAAGAGHGVSPARRAARPRARLRRRH